MTGREVTEWSADAHAADRGRSVARYETFCDRAERRTVAGTGVLVAEELKARARQGARSHPRAP